MRTNLRALLLATALFVPASTLAQQAPSAPENPLASRAQLPPALRFLEGQGVKLTSLGEIGGLQGYLGEGQQGRMQVFYLSPDGEHVIAGVMFRNGGANVTGLQIAQMQQRFDETRRRLEDERRQAEEARRRIEEQERGLGAQSRVIEGARNQLGGGIEGFPLNGSPGQAGARPVPAPGSASPPAAAPAAAPAANPTPAPATGQVRPTPAPAPAPLPTPIPTPAPTPQQRSEAPAAGAPQVSQVSRADFEAAARNAAWFSVGAPDAPVVYMVADPQCPHCHRAWSDLRPLIERRELQLKIIMISGLPGSEPLALSILARSDAEGGPGRAWASGEGSVAGVPVAPPPPAGSTAARDAAHYLRVNMDFARRLNVTATPFLAYVGRDGRLYATQGLASGNVGGFLSAQPQPNT